MAQTRVISSRLPGWLVARLDEEAARLGIPRTQVMVDALSRVYGPPVAGGGVAVSRAQAFRNRGGV